MKIKIQAAVPALSLGAWSGFPSLVELVIEDCLLLERAPNDFPSLRELTVTNIRSSHPLLNIMTNKRSLKCLKKVHIERVKELTHIPEELGECISLQMLWILECEKLTSLPENLSKLVSLKVLKIQRCSNLVSLRNLSGLGSLREFKMLGSDGFPVVPEGLQSCKSLEILWIGCCSKVETLPGLTKMIKQPPDWLLYSLSCLRILQIGYYTELSEFPDLSPLLNIKSLVGLRVYGWEKLHSLPEQLQHFTKLKALEIADFENLKHLPDFLGNLPSLQKLQETEETAIRGWELKAAPCWQKPLRKMELSITRLQLPTSMSG